MARLKNHSVTDGDAEWPFPEHTGGAGSSIIGSDYNGLAVVTEVISRSGTTYFDGAQFVHFLLGPATVSLAIPLYRQRERLRALALPIAAALLAGVLTAALSGIGFAALLGASKATLISLAPKSVTAPVAMGISEKLGGLPSLTAVLVVSTGIVGAVFGTGLFRLLRIQDDAIKGFAMGTSSHGIGTARAFQVSPVMGAFSGLAMALSALVTALLLPPLLHWIGLVA